MSKFTQCTVCGKVMEYTTRKPKYCEEHKKVKPKKKTRGGRFPRNKGTQGEVLLFHILNHLLTGYEFVNHGYYSMLPSPKGQPLQIDRYYPDLKLGFEYDGKQHDEYVKFIHKSKNNFEYQKLCDKLKDQYCAQKGINLIRISHRDKLTDQLIRDKIKESNTNLYSKLMNEGKLKGEFD